MTVVAWACEHAAELLAPLGDRWAHTQGVVCHAEAVSSILPARDQKQLVAAAFVHDVGYAPMIEATGLHALDGARHLRSLGYERLARLVAHHSCARFEAEVRGLLAELLAFPPEESALADALTYCDMTTGPTGTFVEWYERLDEICARYGEDHVVTVAMHAARPCIEGAIARTERRLEASGLSIGQPM